MKADTPEEIEFGQWKRVAVDDKGRKMIMKVVTHSMTKDEFLKHMSKQVENFTSHVQRVKRQYAESQKIKKNLPANEVVVNMDFAENYSCKSVEEIQSAYWNQSAVTLHPVVIYHKDGIGDLKHTSIVIVSDEMGHNTNTVMAFLDKIVPEVKKLVPTVSKIHYYTDSPTSQYRNKTIFHLVSNHEDTYRCKATWNFFEAGHGKGPCDGLGGTTKRMADEAVKTGKVTIQDADEFYQWTQSPFCSLRSVKFLYVPSTECQLKADDLSRTTIKPIKGTMKIHAVVGKGQNSIETSAVSCNCDKCITGETCGLNQWTQETLVVTVSDKSDGVISVNQTDEVQPVETPQAADPPLPDILPTDYVAAMYDGEVYIGKILEYDDVDGDVEITFMENVRKLLQWPKHEERIWVDRKNIICTISEPVPTGKTKRMFKLSAADTEKIESQMPVASV